MEKQLAKRIVRTTESGQGPYGQFIIAGRHVLSADEPAALGGSETGPDPYELLLASLGACTAMTIRMYANRKAWPLAHVEVALAHFQDIAADGEPEDRFERLVELRGDLSVEQRERLLEIADRCPVSRTLKHGARVTVASLDVQDATATG